MEKEIQAEQKRIDAVNAASPEGFRLLKEAVFITSENESHKAIGKFQSQYPNGKDMTHVGADEYLHSRIQLCRLVCGMAFELGLWDVNFGVEHYFDSLKNRTYFLQEKINYEGFNRPKNPFYGVAQITDPKLDGNDYMADMDFYFSKSYSFDDPSLAYGNVTVLFRPARSGIIAPDDAIDSFKF